MKRYRLSEGPRLVVNDQPLAPALLNGGQRLRLDRRPGAIHIVEETEWERWRSAAPQSGPCEVCCSHRQPTRRALLPPPLAAAEGSFMRLDAAVESALNVLPTNTDAATSFSLYGLLNKAQTAMGKALLKAGAAPRQGCGQAELPRMSHAPCCCAHDNGKRLIAARHVVARVR